MTLGLFKKKSAKKSTDFNFFVPQVPRAKRVVIHFLEKSVQKIRSATSEASGHSVTKKTLYWPSANCSLDLTASFAADGANFRGLKDFLKTLNK
jgi:hypothetical protein